MRALLVAAIAAAAAAATFAACSESLVSRTIGARCDAPAECEDRCLLPSADFPGGFCTLDCGSARDCPSGATCVDRGGGVCLLACLDDTDCAFLGEGWRCREENPLPDGEKVRACRGG